jgi:Methyltransferase domain
MLNRFSSSGLKEDNRSRRLVSFPSYCLTGILIGCLLGSQAKLFFGPMNVCLHSDPNLIQAENNENNLAFSQSYGFFDDISNQNWQLMQERALHRINHRFKSPLKFYDEPARWYMNNFEPDFTCGHERRVGGVGDGPKW